MKKGGDVLAKLECTLRGSKNTILHVIDQELLGGSEALVFKINTFGEEAFLERLVDIVRQFRV